VGSDVLSDFIESMMAEISKNAARIEDDYFEPSGISSLRRAGTTARVGDKQNCPTSDLCFR
jgi:hypothetical protein